MASPVPPQPLEGHCSVIYDGVLYVYSPKAFQALPLQKGGTWKQLKNGVSVSGAACVKQANAGSSDNDALWVVGGAAADSKSGYPGLQKYSFASKEWQTITPVVKVTENRQSHAAVFLRETSEILVYAGSQDNPSTESIETFTIGTVAPYNVNSYTSKNTPVVAPLLLQWDESSAITVGGADDNKQIFLFQAGGTNPWQEISPALPAPLKSSSMEQASLVHGTDGSKILELYDCSVSPTNVTQLVLQGVNGKAAKEGEVPGSKSSQKRKRDISLHNWPNYKSKYAPKKPRSGFSLAQSDGNMVAISGGISNGHQSVELFDEATNAWIDTTSFFGPKAVHQVPFHHKTSSSHSHHQPSHAPTHKPHSPSVTPNNTNSDHSDTTTILGAVLGSVIGFVLLLTAVLLLLRYRRREKRRQARDTQEREEKHRLSFADRGDPYMKEVGDTGFYPHEPQIQVNGTPHHATHHRSDTRGSESSTTLLVPKIEGVRMNDAMEMGPIRENGGLAPPPRSNQNQNSLLVPGTEQKRTSGWSRYFSGADLLSGRNSQVKSARTSDVGEADPRKSTPDSPIIPMDRDTPGIDRSRSVHDCSTHGPTRIPPLDMGQTFSEGKVNQVVTGQPRSESRQSVDRPETRGSTQSGIPPSMMSDTFRSQGTHEDSMNWTPVTRSEYTLPGLRNTTTSSIYERSLEAGEPGPLYQQSPRLGGPGGPSVRMVSGASVIGREQTIAEEQATNPNEYKPIVPQVVQMPARKPLQTPVQDDMGWLNLGSKG